MSGAAVATINAKRVVPRSNPTRVWRPFTPAGGTYEDRAELLHVEDALDSAGDMPSMNLTLPTVNLENYKSASQRARVVTESWGASNFFCSLCESPQLRPVPHNTAASGGRTNVCAPLGDSGSRNAVGLSTSCD